MRVRIAALHCAPFGVGTSQQVTVCFVHDHEHTRRLWLRVCHCIRVVVGSCSDAHWACLPQHASVFLWTCVSVHHWLRIGEPHYLGVAVWEQERLVVALDPQVFQHDGNGLRNCAVQLLCGAITVAEAVPLVDPNSAAHCQQLRDGADVTEREQQRVSKLLRGSVTELEQHEQHE